MEAVFSTFQTGRSAEILLMIAAHTHRASAGGRTPLTPSRSSARRLSPPLRGSPVGLTVAVRRWELGEAGFLPGSRVPSGQPG